MSGSLVEILYDGTDIAGDVIFEDAEFTMQMNGIPGTCRFRVRDMYRTHSFTTGKELQLSVDGTPVWGGFLRRVSSTYAFPADDTDVPDYHNRIFLLEGSDYNILWDTRVLRNTSDYTSHLPDETGYDKTTEDGWAVWKMLRSFSDFPTDFDITATRSDAVNVEDIRQVLPSSSTRKFFYKQQSTKLRDQMDEFAKMSAATYYVGAEKSVHYHSIEHVVKRWGFSDTPNYAGITSSPADYQNADWGFRDVTGEEDGTMIFNDVLVWGGSVFGSSGHVIFARVQDAVSSSATTTYTYIESGSVTGGSSIDTHGRWQFAETNFGGGVFGNLDGVKARANAILDGPPGTSSYDGSVRGLRYPQWVFRFNWYAHRVPKLSGTPDHIRAGDIVKIKLQAFGVEQFAPARSISITFPGTETADSAWVMFSGEFSYSYTDSTSWWKAIINANKDQSSPPAISVANDSSVTTGYGDYGNFTPVESADGSRTLFTLPNGFGYLPGTLQVFVDGLLASSVTETSDTTFTMASPPTAGATLVILCRTTAT